MATIQISGIKTEVPAGAIAYKYADPTEGARWVYDESELNDIRREDPSLIVEVAAVTLNGRPVDFQAAVALMDDDLRERAHGLVINDEQAFLDCYCSLHAEKFGEEFQVA